MNLIFGGPTKWDSVSFWFPWENRAQKGAFRIKKDEPPRNALVYQIAP